MRDEITGLPMLSRREMLGGVVASTLAFTGMMLLPKEEEGVCFVGFNPLGATEAHASEVWSGSFSFTVVGADEVGIQVVDVSGLTDYDPDTEEKNGKPVEDATVTLTSLYNGKTVSDKTDEEGKVILPIRALAFSTSPADGVFRANVSISVTTEDARVKMRDFSAGRVCLEGATGLVIGTHKTDATDVYLERCTFNGWDIHYSKLTFMRSKENTDGDHTIDMRIKGASDDVSVSMTILDAADKTKTIVATKATTATYDSSTGLAEGQIQGHFLETGHDDCISVDDAILRITYSAGGKDYTNDIEICVEDTPIDSAVVSGPIIPFTNNASTLFTFTATGDWPCFNGLSFSVLGPFPAVQVSGTPFSGIVSVGTNFNMMDDQGHFSKDSWKKDHKGNIFARYKNMQDRIVDKYNQRKDAGKEVEMYDLGDPEPQAATKKSPFLKNIEVNILARLGLMWKYAGLEGQNENRKNVFEGTGTVELGIDINGTLTFEFMAGPVPMYVSGTAGLTALAAFTVKANYLQLANTKELDCTNMAWALKESLGLLIKILLKLSIGVGYKGIVSLSFDATFTFPFYFGWLEEGASGERDPHITIGVTIMLEIVLQAGLFRLSGQIYSYSKPGWYNNWDSSSMALTDGNDTPSIESRFLLTHPGESTPRHTVAYDRNGMMLTAEDPFSLMIPVTNAQMMGSREADATRIGEDEVALQAANRPTPKVHVGKMPRAVVREDGSIATELVDCEGVNTFFFGEVADADETPELLTVAADGDEAAGDEAPVFLGDPLLGYGLGATREYTYTPIAGKTTGAVCNAAAVYGIAAHDGVEPEVNAVIYKDVHSDPRQRVVTIGGVTYLFRIMTVQYPTANGSYCRSRVVASAYDANTGTWGDPKVIEYNTGNRDLPRVDIYDYEFDIAVRTGDDPWTQEGEACLIVTGGMRPNGDDTTFHEAYATGTVAVLVIDKDLEVLQCVVRGMQSTTEGAELFADDAAENMVMSPVIVDGFGAGGASGSLAYAFLRRSAATQAGLTTSAATVTFCVGYCYVRDGYLTFPADLVEGPALAADVFGVKGVAGDPVAGQYDALLTLLVNHQDGYDVCTATVPAGGIFSQLQITHCIQSTDKLPEIQPWPHHGTFLFVKERPAALDGPDPDYHLYEGTFTVGQTGQTAFGETQVDMAGLKGASFCVSPSGEFIFYYASYRDDPDSNPEADVVSNNVTGSGDDSVYNIMASRLTDGLFCEDFPFCEIDHPIDHIEVLNLLGDDSSFIATHITDADNSLADLHYIAVPNVLMAEIEAFVQTQPFVCAGHDAPFSMDVKNHGNLIIGGFDVQMLDPGAGGTVVDSAHVGAIDPSKITLNASNMGWGCTSSETPQLTDAESQGYLMPGKKMSYGVTFKIPDSWEGDKTVVLRIVNAWTPGVQATGLTDSGGEAIPGEFNVELDGLVVRGIRDGIHHYHLGTNGSLSLADAREGAGTVYDPAEAISENGSDPSGPDVKPDDANNGGQKKSEGIPPTGDVSLPVPLALAVAGATALAAGYTARRLENEHES